MIMYHQTKFCSKRISKSEDTVETVIFWSYEPLLTVTLKIANKSFCMTLQPIMMHHNTEFGSKMCGGLENIIWLNIGILTLCCDLDCNNPIFPQDTLAYDNLSSDHVWLPKNQQFIRYSSQSNILIIWALAVTLTLKTANNFCFAWHSGSFCSITKPCLVTKCFVVHKISSGQIFRHFKPSLWPWPWTQ